jgi:AcrR family transcriptional regulator
MPSISKRARRPGVGGGARPRLGAGERRGELVRVAAILLTRRGVDAVQVAEVAAASRVSRQLVYKFFPSRQALLRAVLDDFAEALTHEFGRRAMHRLPANLEDGARVFIEAVCDTIEVKGAGPWYLLDSKGPDPELGRLGQEIMDRLVAPWHTHIAQVTGMGAHEAAVVARMLVAAGSAVLDLWCAGEITRDDAVRYATLGVTTLLERVPARAGRTT